jgi:hypothetical protein
MGGVGFSWLLPLMLGSSLGRLLGVFGFFRKFPEGGRSETKLHKMRFYR